jgi:thioredoxin 1
VNFATVVIRVYKPKFLSLASLNGFKYSDISKFGTGLASSLSIDYLRNHEKIAGRNEAMITRILLGVLIGGAIGAILGYLGKCSSGSCPLTANPYRGAIYGAVVGALLVSVISTRPKEKPELPNERMAVKKEKTEISKEKPEGSGVVHIENKSDSNVGVLKENGSSLMETLTRESFLQKVFNYEQNKEWKFEGTLPCIVDFYADWCGPCKMVEPILEELAQEYQGKLNIYRVDTQAQQELAATFGIQSIPSILFIPLNDKPQMAIGALPKNTLEKAIKEVLKVE